MEWAAPAAGGGMTLLSTTTCSGSTITVSSISQSYNSLEIWINGLTWGTANNVIWFYPYDGNTFETDVIYNTSSSAVGTVQNNGLKITPAGDGTRTGGLNCWTVKIDNYASSSNRKPISFYGGYNDSTPVFGHGLITTNSALSSFVLATNSGYTFDGGTIKVYGVK